MKASSWVVWLSSWVLACGGSGPPAEEHTPPEILEAYQSATTVEAGGTVTFRLVVREEGAGDHRFTWNVGSGTLGAPTTLASLSEVVWKAPPCMAADTQVQTQVSVANVWQLWAHTNLTVTVRKGCVGWLGTGKMSTPRARHTASVLSSGKVLVAGGATNATQVASAELYDPATGLWTPTGSMATARMGHTATVLLSGKVLITGGEGPEALDTAELYDPETGVWTSAGTLSTPRKGHTATVLPSGKILVVGGDGGGSIISSSVELYDPATGMWTPTGALARPRMNHAACMLLSGKVLVTGGRNLNEERIASTELYDPATGSWTPGVSLPVGREEHVASVLPSGKVLVVGGRGEYSERAAFYDPAANSWRPEGKPGRQRYHTASVLPSGRVLVVGGDVDAATSYAEVFDPETRGWTLAGISDTGRHSHTASVLPSGQVLVVGGSSGSLQHLDTAELYDVTRVP